MVTRRSAKIKGSQFEYDCCYNLSKKFPNVYLTKERGYVRQFDICSDVEKLAFECKNHSQISWNRMKKYFFKLKEKAPEGYYCLLLIKTLQQPPLVMSEHDGLISLQEFEQKFGVKFEKHPPIKRN